MWGINGWVRRRNQYSVTANDKFHSALIRIRPVYICLPAPSSLSASASGRLLLNLNIINYGTILTEVIRPYWSCDYIQWELRESWPDAFRPEAFYCRQLFLSCFISGLSLLQIQSFVCFFFIRFWFDFDSILIRFSAMFDEFSRRWFKVWANRGNSTIFAENPERISGSWRWTGAQLVAIV